METSVPHKSALIGRLSQHAQKRPDVRAFTFIQSGSSDKSYSYLEIETISKELGQKIARLDLPRSAPLGILLKSQHDQVLHYLAALYAGFCPVILTPPHRKLNKDYYLQTMQKILSSHSFCGIISDESVSLEDSNLLNPFSLALKQSSKAAVRGSDLEGEFFQFTSGTTNLKSTVVIKQSSVIRQLETYGTAIGLDSSDVILSWLPLYHDMGFMACLNMPLFFGVHTVMVEPIDWVAQPDIYLKAIAEYRATLSWNPNFAYAFMAQRANPSVMGKLDLSSLRGLVNCSELVTRQSQSEFQEKFSACGLRKGIFWGCYAMAETTFALTHGIESEQIENTEPTLGAKLHATDDVSVGKPLPGVSFKIVDESGQSQPQGVAGEILVDCPFLFEQYLDDPEKTKSAFDETWYRTGDIGYIENQELFVCGRKKEVIISAGANYYPQALESVAAGISGVMAGRVAAFGMFDDEIQTERVVVLAETNLIPELRTKALIELRTRLFAAFQCAYLEAHLMEPGWLIKSSSGKMARNAVREKWKSQGRRAISVNAL